MICHVLQEICHLKNKNIIKFKYKNMIDDQNYLNLKYKDQFCEWNNIEELKL